MKRIFLAQGVGTIYGSFAYIYDRLMYDVDYKGIAEYIEDLFEKYGIKPEMVADLGCGTGSLCIELAKKGYEMIGVDMSPEMLSCARSKTLEEGLDILYLNQDMSSFELYGTVDAFVSIMDSVNYITGKNDVKRLFKLVNNYLNPGGLFIFDINTRYKLEKVLGNNVFYDIDDDISYIWQSRYDGKKKLCEFDLTYFIREGDTYKRFDELHHERVYELPEIKKMIENAGLRYVAAYDGTSFKCPSASSQRNFIVCRKV